MERYSKTYASKWQNQYTDDFKLKVCREYIEGEHSLSYLERKYNLGNSRLSSWLRSYGMQIKHQVYVPSDIMPSKDDSTKPLEGDSIAVLKRHLEDVLLEKELYRRMIEVAERDLKISIRKKSVTK